MDCSRTASKPNTFSFHFPSFLRIYPFPKTVIFEHMKKPLISITEGKRSGQPCIRNLRITVGDILSYLASGMTKEEIIDDFPELTTADIQAALAYAADQLNKTVTVTTS